MALAAILSPPSDVPGFFIWAQAHASHHYNCVSAASVKLSRQFSNFVLDPFDPENMANWLQQHQQMHQDMDLALGLTGGYDLSELDWKDPSTWFTQNYAEHQAWAKILSVG